MPGELEDEVATMPRQLSLVLLLPPPLGTDPPAHVPVPALNLQIREAHSPLHVHDAPSASIFTHVPSTQLAAPSQISSYEQREPTGIGAVQTGDPPEYRQYPGAAQGPRLQASPIALGPEHFNESSQKSPAAQGAESHDSPASFGAVHRMRVPSQ